MSAVNRVKYPLYKHHPQLDKEMKELCSLAHQLSEKKIAAEKNFDVEIFFSKPEAGKISCSLEYPS